MPNPQNPCQESASPEAAARDLPSAYHHVYALLHTLQHLAAQQDHLCTLLAEIRRTGRLSASLRRELAALLENLPTAALEAELYAALNAVQP